MKFTLSWIREFVDISDTPDACAELARRLTSVGLPVETISESSGHGPVLDIEVFSNRPDCMNVYGVARETAAATGHGLAPYPGQAAEDPAALPAASLATVTVNEPELCGRYSARVVKGRSNMSRSATSPAGWCSATSRSRSRRARAWAWRGGRGQARARCCTCCRGSWPLQAVQCG